MASQRLTTRRALIKGGAALPAIAIPTVTLAQTPDERVEAAIEELKSALADKYPGWTIATNGGTQSIFRVENGVATPRPVQTVVVVDAQEPSPLKRRVVWSNEYI